MTNWQFVSNQMLIDIIKDWLDREQIPLIQNPNSTSHYLEIRCSRSSNNSIECNLFPAQTITPNRIEYSERPTRSFTYNIQDQTLTENPTSDP